MLVWVIVAVIPIALLGSFFLASNGRASRRKRTADVWSETEVDYKARHDLIPTLEETLRGYTFRPRRALQAVTTVPTGAFAARAAGGPNVIEQGTGDL